MAVAEDLLAPIDTERPGGTEVTYEVDYSRLAALRDVRNAEHDYEEVVELATKILTEDSKDLTVAIWLAEARLALHGFEGLAAGLHLVHGLLDRFWDHLYPEAVEDRAFALEFVGEGLKSREDKYEAIKFVSLTDWGHNLHHFEEWKGLRRDSFGGPDPNAKKRKDQDDDDPRAPTSENFESGFAETSKATYRALEAQLGDCDRAVAALEALVTERFAEVGSAKPGFGKLKTALGRASTAVGVLLARKLETDPDPVDASAPVPTEGAQDATAAPGPGTPATVAMGLTPEPTDPGDAVRRITGAVRFLRHADPTNPAPYVLLRGLRWGELRQGGGALDVRLLDAPPTELRKRLKSLLLEGDWAGLVEMGEEVMASPCGRGWLDLQRYVLTALEGMGGAYRPAVDAIRHEISALLRDVPDLTSKTLMDDTPTANVETLEWLALQGLTGEPTDGASGGGVAPPDYDRERVLSEATHEKALEWVAAGNPSRGVELLMKRAEREESARARFITESLAASILVDAGMVSVARPMLEDLVDLVSKKTLDQWESAEVVARPIGLLYRCLPANDRRRAQLYDQICRLDPMLAISLDRQEAAGRGASGPPPQELPDEPTRPDPNGPTVDPGSVGG
jgi:type VI secretion system protein ImpA